MKPGIAMAAEPAKRGISITRGQPGFTLIELVVMMIVIGILAVVVVPRFSLLRGYDEVGYRDKVKAALEFARKTAVAQRRYACAVVSGYDLTLTIESVMPENASHVASCPYTRHLTLPAPDSKCSGGEDNKVCHPSSVTLTDGTILFDAQGRPVSGVDTTFTIVGDSTSMFTVYAETGYVH